MPLYGHFHQGVIQGFLIILPVYRVSTTDGAEISEDLVNDIKGEALSYRLEEQVKLLHNIMIYFSCRR